MERTFIILPEFDKNWKAMGLSDEDLRRLGQKRQCPGLLCGFRDSGNRISHHRLSQKRKRKSEQGRTE